MVNLKNKETALKATWPQILKTEKSYAQLVYTSMRVSRLGEDIWRCTLSPEDVKNLSIKNKFWEDTLRAWCSFNYTKEPNIENQLIWYNSNIRTKQTPFFWGDVYDKGLRYVHQLFKDQEFKPHKLIWEQFGLTTLRYNTLKTALPTEWKNYFMEHHETQFLPMLPHNYDRCLTQGNLSSTIYNHINGNHHLLINKLKKWTEELGEELWEDTSQYAASINSTNKITNVPKYRSFQYRTMHRALVTNIHLNMWNMTTTNMCQLCNTQKETTIHMLFECEKVYPLWLQLKAYILDTYQCNISLNKSSVIQNTVGPTKYHLSNLLCLVTKQFIYRQRCLKNTLHFPQLKSEINKVQNIEKYIAVKNNKLSIHQCKWHTQSSVTQNVPEYIEQYIHHL